MKTLLTAWLFFTGYLLSAQVLHPDEELPAADSLAVVPLVYQVLDSQKVTTLITEYMDINRLFFFNYYQNTTQYFALGRVVLTTGLRLKCLTKAIVV